MKREIVVKNFDEIFPEIVSEIKLADFIAIDAEFSGIASDSLLENSLFDTGKDRYTTVRKNIKDYTIIQFGLTSFYFKRDENKYEGSTYMFYICKTPINIHPTDPALSFQLSALDFLSDHDFDLNKVIYEGIDCLNIAEEKMLCEDLKKCCTHYILSPEAQKAVIDECARISKWVESAHVNDVLLLLNEIDYTKKLEVYLSLKQIQDASPSVQIFIDKHGKVLVTKVSDANGASGQNKSHKKKTFLDDFVEYCAGFSRLFKLLSSLKKPIVGHNILLDLMFMHHQFHEHLPESYSKFKKNIHSLFPVIYDTKFISYEMRALVERDVNWDSNELCELYNYFKDGHGFKLAAHTPIIKLKCAKDSDSEPDTDVLFHEAGWDSFCTGYCFIRMMHYFATQKILACKMVEKPLVNQQHLHSVIPYMNRVNLARAHINHLRLDGPDPESTRPKWLVVTSTYPDMPKDIMALRECFDSIHGCIDVRVISKNQFLLAANSGNVATEVLDRLSHRIDWKIVTYKPMEHDPRMRTLRWVVLVSGMSLGVWMVRRLMSNLA